MLSLPSARRWLSPLLILTVVIAVIQFLSQQFSPSQNALLQAVLQRHLHRELQFTLLGESHEVFSLEDIATPGRLSKPQAEPSIPLPLANHMITTLQTCSASFNPTTEHIRLPDSIYNISLTPPDQSHDATVRFFNPAVLPLPHWSGAAKYVLVSRVVTSGFHQESHICLADICRPVSEHSSSSFSPDTRVCTASDLEILGEHGGLRCISPSIKINIPPTPAESCEGAWRAFPDIPGFHDPRIFWSGKGEPLILVNSASRYGCVGLWMVDLRRLFPELGTMLRREASSTASVMSYPHLTEVTRNPRTSRTSVEKNWLLWFPNREEAYVQYDLIGRRVHGGELNSTNGTVVPRRGGRTFAKLIGNGFTTPNLTDADERTCFGPEYEKDKLDNHGHWHQGSNALRLILCTRAQARSGECEEGGAVDDGRSVHFAIMHRKFSNAMNLPLRYERYVVVWESRAPFQVLGVSRWPLLMRNERANPWTEDENWPEERSGWNGTRTMFAKRIGVRGKEEELESDHIKSEAYFTYTPSLAWAWKPHSAGLGDEDEDEDDVEYMSSLGTGYLGDEVLVGIGMDDLSQGFAKVKVEDLLQCLRLCPGVKLAQEETG